MPELTRAWLEPYDWEFVTEVNRGLCKQKNALHKATSDGHDSARALWEGSMSRNMTLTEAFQVCQHCHRLAPFCLYNGNTFAGIARDLIADISTALIPDEAHILRSIAGHIVAGTATEIEEQQFEKILKTLAK
jgi:hypothetical protein